MGATEAPSEGVSHITTLLASRALFFLALLTSATLAVMVFSWAHIAAPVTMTTRRQLKLKLNVLMFRTRPPS